jgi:hypothetical protein
MFLDKDERFCCYGVMTYMIPWIAALNWYGKPAAIAYACVHFVVIFSWAIWLSLPLKKK